jgi:hypothetical protein
MERQQPRNEPRSHRSGASQHHYRVRGHQPEHQNNGPEPPVVGGEHVEEFIRCEWEGHGVALVSSCGARALATGRGRSISSAQEHGGQHHDPEQKDADVDALPNSYPRCWQIRLDVGGIWYG